MDESCVQVCFHFRSKRQQFFRGKSLQKYIILLNECTDFSKVSRVENPVINTHATISEWALAQIGSLTDYV